MGVGRTERFLLAEELETVPQQRARQTVAQPRCSVELAFVLCLSSLISDFFINVY